MLPRPGTSVGFFMAKAEGVLYPVRIYPESGAFPFIVSKG
jgi:hypothetical protein